MKRLLAIAFALFAVSTAQAQQKTTSAIKTDITNLFPSNGAGAITAIQLRAITNEIADSYANKGGDTLNGPMVLRHQNVLGGAVSVAAPPSSVGSWDTITTAFNGDLSKVSNGIAHSITGTTTLGQPVSGYLYTAETYPNLTYLYNSSGWNQSTSTNDGRTAAAAYRTKVDNYGQGDAVAYNCSTFVTGTRAGSTDFLANPAVACFNGDQAAATDGTYLNFGEGVLHDGSHDVAGIGWVMNLDRNVATGAKNAYWAGFRSQSIGAASVDSHFSAVGKARTGLDLSGTTFDPSGTWTQAAVVLPQSARIYGNATYGSGGKYTNTSTGVDWIERSTFGFWNFVFNNTSAFQVADTQVTALPLLQANNGVNVSSGSSYQINGANALSASKVSLPTSTTPASSSAACTTGDHAWDSGFVYVCVGTNTWKRAALTTW